MTRATALILLVVRLQTGEARATHGPGDAPDTQHRFGGHVGGGLQFFISDHFSIDSTYRHIWLERLESRNPNLEDKKFNDNGHMVTIGLNVPF